MATKYYDTCPQPNLFHGDGTDTTDCGHCYECPACGANELAGEVHDGHCGLAGADPAEIGAESRPSVSEIAAHWTGAEYYVQREDWRSADGDEWATGDGTPASGPDFDGARITLLGGPRDGEVVG